MKKLSEEKSAITITATIEDYLEQILFLSELHGAAKVTDIAEELGVRKASVTEMVTKLRDSDLVNYEKYGTITLTTKGKKIAEKIRQRHEIIKSFLLLLGVDEETANNDCCVMEHNLTKETVAKLNSFINFLEEEEQKDILERFKKYEKNDY